MIGCHLVALHPLERTFGPLLQPCLDVRSSVGGFHNTRKSRDGITHVSFEVFHLTNEECQSNIGQCQFLKSKGHKK